VQADFESGEGVAATRVRAGGVEAVNGRDLPCGRSGGGTFARRPRGSGASAGLRRQRRVSGGAFESVLVLYVLRITIQTGPAGPNLSQP
jgi:hypothetical protein